VLDGEGDREARATARGPAVARKAVVIVLGAGAAGLAAARVLRRAGAAVIVVEARARLGGRVDTRIDRVLGVPVEHGAEFVHGRPASVIALAAEAGLRLRRVPDRHLALTDGRLAREGKAFRHAVDLLERGTRRGESVAALLSRLRRAGEASAEELRFARGFVEGFYLADPRTASSAALARMERGLATIGEGMFRAEGGWAAALAPLSRSWEREAGSLRLGTAVEVVRWRPGRVEVHARGVAGGRLPPIAGARAVVTFPVGVLRAGRVRFSPALPGIARAAARVEMGPVVKVILRFRDPPWDPGTVFLHVPRALVPVFWTLAPLRAPILVGWVGGPRAARLSRLGAPATVQAALASAGRALRRSPGVLEERLEWAEVVDWARDPLALGGYAVFPVGAEDAPTELARAVADTLFFAGEATDPDFAGTVDGALRSGERAAREVLATL
jgi:monoamine oxidase